MANARADGVSAMSPRLKRIGGPRGLLRSYIIYRLSKEQMSGYDLISDIGSVMGGTWHPGSGSIYPILEELKRGRLIEVVSKGRRSRQVYALTALGSEALEEERKMINQFAAKWNRIRLTMMDLVSAENLSTILLESAKADRAAWTRVIESKEMPREEVAFKLKERKLLLEGEMRWIEGQLEGRAVMGRRHGGP